MFFVPHQKVTAFRVEKETNVPYWLTSFILIFRTSQHVQERGSIGNILTHNHNHKAAWRRRFAALLVVAKQHSNMHNVQVFPYCKVFNKQNADTHWLDVGLVGVDCGCWIQEQWIYSVTLQILVTMNHLERFSIKLPAKAKAPKIILPLIAVGNQPERCFQFRHFRPM